MLSRNEHGVALFKGWADGIGRHQVYHQCPQVNVLRYMDNLSSSPPSKIISHTSQVPVSALVSVLVSMHIFLLGSILLPH